MTQWLKTTGKLVYDPTRKDLRKTFKSRTLIVELPWDDLDLYYQWFLLKRYGTWFQTQRPMWGKHVTIVRGDEKGYLSPNWGKHAGRKVDVYYSPEVSRKWKFWSLPVKGEGLEELRVELGLVAKHDFHLTFARQYDWQPELA